MQTHRDIIDLWPNRADFAGEVGIKYWRACGWYRRNSIASEFWDDVVRAAHKRGFSHVSNDLLASIKSGERTRAEHAAA